MSVTIKIEGEGLRYEKDTNIIKASQIIAFLNSDQAESIQQSEETINKAPTLLSSSINKSPREAIIESNAKTNAQKFLVLGSYSMLQDNKLTFTQGDVMKLFQRAGEPKPGNISRDIKNGIELNYYYQSETAGEFIITDYGQNLIQNGFSNEELKTTPKKRSLGTKKSIKVVSEEVKKIETYSPELEGFPNFYQLKTKGEKILWILAFADHSGASEITPSDIEYIADKLRDKVPTSGFTALSEGIFKKGYITRSSQGKVKILYKGLEELKNHSKKTDTQDEIRQEE